MFEGLLEQLLLRLVGEYVDGLNRDRLHVSVWQGDVVLTDLKLKPGALDFLELPIRIIEGKLCRLTIKVPWHRIHSEPVCIAIDGVHVLCAPRTAADAVQSHVTRILRRRADLSARLAAVLAAAPSSSSSPSSAAATAATAASPTALNTDTTEAGVTALTYGTILGPAAPPGSSSAPSLSASSSSSAVGAADADADAEDVAALSDASLSWPERVLWHVKRRSAAHGADVLLRALAAAATDAAAAWSAAAGRGLPQGAGAEAAAAAAAAAAAVVRTARQAGAGGQGAGLGLRTGTLS